MSKRKEPSKSNPVEKARSASRARLLAAGKAPASGPKTVLFDYATHPTKTIRAVRPEELPPSKRFGMDEPLSKDALDGALSRRPVPTWDDRDAPATIPPRSQPPHFESEPGDPGLVRGVLTRIDGPDAGRVFSLSRDQLTIGRSHRADLHLPDEGVSRKHARICLLGDAFVLEDLSSRNGTFVSRRRIDRVQLRQGDLIRVGAVATFRFCWMDAHQEALLMQLYETSVRDALTGAFNRRYLQKRIEAELTYSDRHRSALSLLLLDIDFFKRVNDEHGHPEGDRVLTEVAAACQRELRTEDAFARYGGEEFAAVLRGVPLVGAIRVAERLRCAVAKRVFVGEPARSVTISIGCCAYDAEVASSADRLILTADRCLYEAKQAGRNRVVAEGYCTAAEPGDGRAP